MPINHLHSSAKVKKVYMTKRKSIFQRLCQRLNGQSSKEENIFQKKRNFFQKNPKKTF